MEKTVNDLLHCKLSSWPFPATMEASWLADGVLQLLPQTPWTQATVVSAGIHGNETAPIEILLQIMQALSEGKQPLSHALLLVFGNLPAIRAGRRYLHNDLNRLFGGRQRIEPALPAQPVAHLRDKAALFALPAFRSREALEGGADFMHGRELPAPQKLEPGRSGEALGFLFGVQVPDTFKIRNGRRHTPRRRRGSRGERLRLFGRNEGRGGVFFFVLFLKIMYVARFYLMTGNM